MTNLTYIDGTGYLHYDPVRRNIVSENRAIIDISNDLTRYYRWWIHKKTGWEILKPSWGSHITVIKYQEIGNIDKTLWGKYENERIGFKYNNHFHVAHNPNTHKYHYFYLRAFSDRLNEIRQELNIPPKAFHITIGMVPKEVWNDDYFKTTGYHLP